MPNIKQHAKGGIAAEQLKSIIQRIERLEEERAGIAADIRDVYAEAKGNGFEVKIIRQVIRLRRLDSSERDEQETILNMYLKAIGMQNSIDSEE